MKTVINIFGAPGSGKSTTAALVYGLAKLGRTSIELVTEYAKELHYAGTLDETPQIDIFTKQCELIDNALKEVDYVVTDSPIPLSIIYNWSEPSGFGEAVWNKFETYNNINFLLNRTKPYWGVGRSESEAESGEIHLEIERLLRVKEAGYYTIDSDVFAAKKILKRVGLKNEDKEANSWCPWHW